MPDRERTNLLYIHSDQHNPFVAGCYGDTLVQTPNLDRLTENGMVFDNAYCTSPICVPSRMSMLTAQHPHQNRVWTNRHILDSGIPTIAHAMGAAGHHPVLIGRMHSVGPDQLHGYAERLVGDHTENYLGGAPADRGVLEGTALPDRISLRKSGSGQSGYQIHDEDVTVAAIDYLNNVGTRKSSGQSEEPFCLTLGFMLPHAPYVARREDYELYRDKITMPDHSGPPTDALHPHLRWWKRHTGIEEVGREEILRARAAYWGLVTRMDTMIGQILDALHENGLDENTLIVYTSDHGDMVGEHGLWWKHTFYEESVRIPLILSLPQVIPAGQRSERVVSALDVAATMLDVLEAPELPSSPGRSLMPLMSGESATWEDEVFSEYCSDEYCPEGGCYQRMIRRGEWKLIYYDGQEPQLFNLADDPHELTDRAQDPACRDVRQELTARVLDGWNPKAIADEMKVKRERSEVLAAWARNTQPKDVIRWTLDPEMNYLDLEP